MTIKRALLLLCAGDLAVAGCSGNGGAPTCASGQACGVDGGGDGAGDGGPVTICLDGQPCGNGAGDGGLAARCGQIPPCGGDVVGEWTFAEVCESAASIAAIKSNFAQMAAQSWCVGQTLVGVSPEASGSLQLDAAGTYALALVFGGYLDINYPASCLANLSCDDATAGFQSQIDAGTFPLRTVTSISCAGSSSCVCRAAVNAPSSETGTYAVSGSVLTFTAATGAVNDKRYCVEGNALHIIDTLTGSMGQTVIDSDLIATKR